MPTLSSLPNQHEDCNWALHVRAATVSGICCILVEIGITQVHSNVCHERSGAGVQPLPVKIKNGPFFNNLGQE